MHIGESAKLSSDFIYKKYKDTVAKKAKEKREAEKAAKESKKKFTLAKSRT